jgi:antitoxin PrlF
MYFSRKFLQGDNMSNSLKITSMTTKGQVVIPSEIRNELNVASGTKFVVISDGKNILLKPIEKPKMDQFKELQKQAQKLAKDAGYSKTDLPKLIKQVRSESRS